jgi:hypothetical protein
MDDDFIENIITPKPQTRNEAMNREFYGMEAVVQFEDEQEIKSENGGDNE